MKMLPSPHFFAWKRRKMLGERQKLSLLQILEIDSWLPDRCSLCWVKIYSKAAVKKIQNDSCIWRQWQMNNQTWDSTAAVRLPPPHLSFHLNWLLPVWLFPVSCCCRHVRRKDVARFDLQANKRKWQLKQERSTTSFVTLKNTLSKNFHEKIKNYEVINNMRVIHSDDKICNL